MKLTPLLTAAFAASAILFTACDKKPEDTKAGTAGASGTATSGGAVSETDALATYKADALAIKEWSEKNEPDAANPVGGIAMIGQMVDKMKAMRTAGLPADLKAAHEKMVAAMGKMQDATKDFPKDAAGFQKFMIEKATADPQFGEKFQTEMGTIAKEVEAAGEALKTAGTKHGLDLDMKPKG
jgi:hypothetical protein